MSCHQNISSEELLNELLERVNRQEIKTYSQYLYNTQKYEIRFYTAKEIVAFRNDWDVKCSARYRQNYEDYCLPLINEKQARENDRELKILKTKINYDRN